MIYIYNIYIIYIYIFIWIIYILADVCPGLSLVVTLVISHDALCLQLPVGRGGGGRSTPS